MSAGSRRMNASTGGRTSTSTQRGEHRVGRPPAEMLDQVLRQRREHDAAGRDARGRDAERLRRAG